MEAKKTSEKDFQKAVNKQNAALDKEFKALQRKYSAECKKKKLTTIPAMNKLWNQKYKKPFDKMDKKFDAAYKRLWLKFHSKKHK